MGDLNKRMLATTGDGSMTLFHPGVGEHYHSKHGAVAESQHVFVGMGLAHAAECRSALLKTTPISVLEIGFGTGLNFLMSAAFVREQGLAGMDYWGIEAFPLDLAILKELGYARYVDEPVSAAFFDRYKDAMEEEVSVIGDIRLRLISTPVLEVKSVKRSFDVVYFDAFAAVHQPDMWTREVFARIAEWMHAGSVLVTYAITGELKRTLRALGFRIEKLPGAPGKREMLRAVFIGPSATDALADQPAD